MDWIEQLNYDKLLLFTLILTRTSGVVMTAPVYGTPDVPVQVRALLAVAMAALVTPTQWDAAIDYPTHPFTYIVFLGSELMIGLVLGLGIAVLMAGIEVAGQVIGQVSGLSIAEIFDPTSGESASVFSRLLFWLTMVVFVAIGGHRMVTEGLLETFRNIPPGSAGMPESVVQLFVTLITQAFGLGIRAAAPLMAAMVLANLILGLISRTLPQLNILLIGFGLNSMLAIGVFTLSVGAAAWVFQDAVEPALDTILQTLGG